ncbi:MAG: hypothetical protein C0446_08425 [Chitinophaga sp.]|nr:hypothetical protein [Chitinophaga sp.]
MFEILSEQSYTTKCPKCVDTRKKSDAKTLQVFRDGDGFIRYRCLHAGQCEWNTWQKMEDVYLDTPPKKKEIQFKAEMPIPSSVTIPEEYNGDKLYWYRDKDGRALFANRRINLPDGKKLYVPFIYSSGSFHSGKGITWPEGFKGLFGAETIPGKIKAVIVEGEKAALAAREIFPDCAVVSWKGGASSISSADWSLLDNIQTILLWPDNDEPGINVMKEIATKLKAESVKLAKVDHLPAKSDLADNIPRDQIKRAVASATEMAQTVAAMSFDSMEEQLNSYKPARPSGFTLLDKNVNLPNTGLLVIEGRTKHGKSAFSIALLNSMMQASPDTKVIYFSNEMQAGKVLMRCLKARHPEATPETRQKFPYFQDLKNLVMANKLKIVDQEARTSVDDVVKAIKSSSIRGGLVIVDYLQILRPTPGFGRQATRQTILKEMLDELRTVAHENDVLVVVLSQLTPDYGDPRNDSPREAKDIHFSADMVIRIWNKDLEEFNPINDKLKGNYFVHVLLNRDGESNVKFDAELKGGSHLQIKRKM